MSASVFDDLRATAHAAADAADVETLAHFRTRGLLDDNKDAGGYDPVTIADRAAERAIRVVLADRRPDDAILGEEEAATPGTSGLTWVIDPIDGTRGYVSGTPTWGTLISVRDDTGPIYGIIAQPYIGERFEGGFGHAAMTGPRGTTPLACRDTPAIEDAVIFTTFPEVGTPAQRRTFEAVADRCKLVRYGMDCYAYALLAGGHIDLVMEAGLNPYDIQAPIAVIQAAGGTITDWTGAPAHDGGTALAAGSATLHQTALTLAAGATA
ncbi:MAG: inositol monophosphatase family protein [Pseudomonadota bacterium]